MHDNSNTQSPNKSFEHLAMELELQAATSGRRKDDEESDGDGEGLGQGDQELLPVLPLRNAVLFPTALMPIVVGRPKTVRLLKHIEATGGMVGV